MLSFSLHIMPVFLLIGLGYLLKLRGAFSNSFWIDVERLTFNILFPSLLIHSIGGANLDGLIDLLPMASALVIACLIVASISIIMWLIFSTIPVLDGPSFCSVFQGITRPNTYIGLAGAYALFGDPGLAILAVCIVAIIPLVNILAVLVHQRWATPEGKSRSFFNIFAGAVKNPVVAACIIGFTLNVSSLGIPPVIGPVLNILGKGALPLGLMAVGAGLSFRTLTEAPVLYSALSFVKLAVLPALTYIIATMFGVDGIALTIAVLFSALPVSATSYVMSRQMNGNDRMMSAIISVTTLVSLFSLPLVISILP